VFFKIKKNILYRSRFCIRQLSYNFSISVFFKLTLIGIYLIKTLKKKNHFLANLAHQSWYPFERLSFKDKIQFNLLLEKKKKTIFVLILYGYFYFVHIFSNVLFWFMSFQLNFILVLIISLLMKTTYVSFN
jgi:hypothetical protein